MKQSSGFTLIELLVSVSVLAVLLTLAAPKLVGTYSRIRVMAEEKKLRELVNGITIKAFCTGTGFYFKTIDNTATILTTSNKIEKRVYFSHIYFPTQNLYINRNGFLRKEVYYYKWNGTKHRLDVE